MLRLNKWFSGLAFRYALYLVIAGLLLSSVLILLASFQQRSTIFRELRERGSQLGKSLANACVIPYRAGDLETVREIILKQMEIQDVEKIVLINEESKIEIQIPEKADVVNLYPEFANISEVQVIQNNNFMHIVAPLYIAQRQSPADFVGMFLEGGDEEKSNLLENVLIGRIYVIMSLKRANESIKKLIKQSILVTLLIIVLGGGTAGFMFFSHNILKPILALVGAMTEVRRGNLNLKIKGVGGGSEIGILTDTFNEMTKDLREAEEELRRVNTELEKRVQERTEELELANLELRESHDKMIRTEKLAAIGKLASGVGHELRNPLGAIQNAIYYLKDSLKGSPILEQDPTLNEMFDLADREISSATNIISDLLDFSRVVRLSVLPTDINNLLLEMKSVLMIPPNIKVIESYEDNLPSLVVDPQKLRQVFINVAINAFQAMPKGGELKIVTRLQGSKDNPESLLEVSFRDTGVGISEQDRKKIFEPLFTTKAKGTGLGLPISIGIVEAHGGKITVSSIPGQKTIFTILLPIGDNNYDRK